MLLNFIFVDNISMVGWTPESKARSLKVTSYLNGLDSQSFLSQALRRNCAQCLLARYLS